MYAKITAILNSGLALSADGSPPHLDAICEFVMSQKASTIAESKNGHRHPVVRHAMGQPVDRQGTLPIPILRVWFDCGGKRIPVPRVSQGIIEPCRKSVVHYHCSFPVDRAASLKPKQRTTIATTGGPLKSHRLPLQIAHTSRVVWFAELRDCNGSHRRSPMSAMRQILKRVNSIGKKTGQGYGQVVEWIVEPTDIDAAWILDNVLMRPLPVDLVPPETQGKIRRFGAVAAPYWQADFFVDRYVPV